MSNSSESNERIAADILIASIHRGSGNDVDYPTNAEEIKQDSVHLAEAFYVIYQAVANAYHKDRNSE